MKFYLLSFLTGVCEIGCICWGYNQGIPPVGILILGVGYQAGNMFPLPCRMKKSQYIAVGILGLLSCFGYYIYDGYVTYICALIALVCCSICLQMGRSLVKKTNNGTTVKRVLRITGFLFSVFCMKYFIEIMLMSLLLAIKTIWCHDISIQKEKSFKWNYIYTVMLFHQMHYFTYVYGTLMYVIENKGIKQAVFYFICTWITYTLVAPRLQRKNKQEYLKWFFMGHTILTIILLFMSLVVDNMALFIPLWIAAGFGGGTVFCITKLGKQSEGYHSDAMLIAENYGHWCGSLFAVLLMSISRNIESLMLASAVFAVLAMITMARGEK